MSSFIDSVVGSIEHRKQFIIAKLIVWVWFGVAVMNGQIITCLIYVFTDGCYQIAYMVKQLNCVWLTAEITA